MLAALNTRVTAHCRSYSPRVQSCRLIRYSLQSEMSELSENYSIWLMPKGPLAEKLGKEMDALAAQYSAPAFKPHVTLIPDIKMTKEETISIAEELAKKLKVCVHFSGSYRVDTFSWTS
jgi:hypothetical protein